MPALQDTIRDALVLGGYGSQINDGMLAWAKANGATADCMPDAIRECLIAQGGTSNSIPDLWNEVLSSYGYTGSLQDKISQFWAAGGTFVTVPTPDFFAPLAVTHVPSTGTDNPTFSRASVGYVIDHEGLLRQAVTNEIRFSRSRRVENLLADDTSADISHASWTKSDPLLSTPTAQRLDFSPTTFPYITDITQAVVQAQRTYTLRARVRATGGGAATSAFRFVCGGVTSSDIAVDGTWRVYSATILSLGTTAGLACGSMTGMIVTDIEVDEMQIEDVTNQANTAPAEYVSTHIEHGANVKGVRYFHYLNSASVDGLTALVTDSNPGATLTTDMAVQADPAINNLITQPEDGTDAYWTNVNLGNINLPTTASTHVANLIYNEFIPSSTLAGEHHLSSAAVVTAINTLAVVQVFVAAGQWDYAYIQVTGGGNSFTQFFNAANGTLGSAVESGIAVAGATIEAVAGGYKCSVQFEPLTVASWVADYGFTDTDGNRTATPADTASALGYATGFMFVHTLDYIASYVGATPTAFDDLKLDPSEFGNISAAPISVGCEVYLPAYLSRAGSILSFAIGDGDQGRVRIGTTSTGDLTVSYHDNAGLPTRSFRQTCTSGFVLGAWNRIAITVGESAGSRLISFNGSTYVLDTSNDNDAGVSWGAAPAHFWIGNWYQDDDTLGSYIRNVRTWQTALTKQELNAATATSPPFSWGGVPQPPAGNAVLIRSADADSGWGVLGHGSDGGDTDQTSIVVPGTPFGTSTNAFQIDYRSGQNLNKLWLEGFSGDYTDKLIIRWKARYEHPTPANLRIEWNHKVLRLTTSDYSNGSGTNIEFLASGNTAGGNPSPLPGDFFNNGEMILTPNYCENLGAVTARSWAVNLGAIPTATWLEFVVEFVPNTQGNTDGAWRFWWRDTTVDPAFDPQNMPTPDWELTNISFWIDSVPNGAPNGDPGACDGIDPDSPTYKVNKLWIPGNGADNGTEFIHLSDQYEVWADDFPTAWNYES